MAMYFALQILGVSLALIASGLIGLKICSIIYDRNTREIEKRQAGE